MNKLILKFISKHLYETNQGHAMVYFEVMEDWIGTDNFNMVKVQAMLSSFMTVTEDGRDVLVIDISRRNEFDVMLYQCRLDFYKLAV